MKKIIAVILFGVLLASCQKSDYPSRSASVTDGYLVIEDGIKGPLKKGKQFPVANEGYVATIEMTEEFAKVLNEGDTVETHTRSLYNPVGMHTFYATWCGPCKKLSPVLDEIAAECSDYLKYSKTDVDENPGRAERWGVMAVPTTFIYNRPAAVPGVFDIVVGAVPKSRFLELIEKHR